MTIVLFANTEWYLFNFRLGLATALRAAGHEVLLASPPGPYGERLRKLGFHWLPAPMHRRSLNPWRELRLLLWLVRLLRRERVALVHGFTIKCAVYGSLAAWLAGNRPRVSAVTGMGYVFISPEPRARLLRHWVRGLMRLALGGRRSRVILQNADDRAMLLQVGVIEPDRVRLIPGSGVDLSRFRVTGHHPPGLPLRVLLAARLLWDKGLSEYIDAVRQLRTQGRSVHCLLAGDPDTGNPASVSEAQVQAWVDEGLIEWLGHVDDMPALLATVDVVVLPSYREGLPKTLIEAAGCGLPLVTTDVPGCRQVVTHEVDGLLVPVRNATALAGAIARLQDDPALARRLGAAAREKALAEFDERIVIQRTMEVYAELCPEAFEPPGGEDKRSAPTGTVL